MTTPCPFFLRFTAYHLRWLMILGWLGLMAWPGCREAKPVPPSVPLPKAKLISVLVDLELAAARQRLVHDVDESWRARILAENQVSQDAFQAWMLYYAENPKAYGPIREDVHRTLLKASNMGQSDHLLPRKP